MFLWGLSCISLVRVNNSGVSGGQTIKKEKEFLTVEYKYNRKREKEMEGIVKVQSQGPRIGDLWRTKTSVERQM